MVTPIVMTRQLPAGNKTLCPDMQVAWTWQVNKNAQNFAPLLLPVAKLVRLETTNQNPVSEICNVVKLKYVCEMSGPPGEEYNGFCLLGCCVV